MNLEGQPEQNMRDVSLPRRAAAFLRKSSCLLLITPAMIAPAAQAQGSLSLTPAVVVAKGTFGQSLTQKLTINNQTGSPFYFEMVAQDVIVKDGKRLFVNAGQLENSIAATAVFSSNQVTAAPFSSASVNVTVTIPQTTTIRAIVATFRARTAPVGAGNVGLMASMGALMTFNLTNNIGLNPAPLDVQLPTDTTNLSFNEKLQNTGTEPLLPQGVAAILNAQSHLVGKATFPIQRLLPGEELVFHAEYPDQLPPGTYTVLCSFQYEGKTASQQGSFTVK